MPRNRTNAAILAAGGTAVLLWFTLGSLGTGIARSGAWSSYLPSIPAGTWWLTSVDAGGVFLVMVLVLALVLALSIPVLRSTRTGGATIVLALWWVTIAAGAMGTLAWSVIRTDRSPYETAWSSATALGPGAWWGLVSGCLVGLVAWRVRGTVGIVPAPAAHRLALPAAVGAAATTAVLAGAAWALSGALRSWALGEILPATSPARQDAQRVVETFLPLSRGMSVPVSDTDGSAYLLGAVALLLVVGLVGTAAGLTASLRGGRTALVLALWLTVVLGSTVAAFVSVLPLTGQVGGFADLLRYGATLVTTGGVWGLMYGWLAALGGLLVGWLVDRSTVRNTPTLLTEVPTPARAPRPGAAG
ncbi:hypothetical protein [Cellulomonas rhizosphaerae]|uniref:Uncharacterized protein n=1 Tax=Cellulomonas rhizosphaerae TaxID=2293719 RepID=A0A413RHU7_9CELL|nr:hypothetical protein [Cellulomonas rhizosphaerae]RHA37784.1 hypothetical protein D1825_16245 [Cellulomonas rhizosphaerae]